MPVAMHQVGFKHFIVEVINKVSNHMIMTPKTGTIISLREVDQVKQLILINSETTRNILHNQKCYGAYLNSLTSPQIYGSILRLYMEMYGKGASKSSLQ